MARSALAFLAVTLLTAPPAFATPPESGPLELRLPTWTDGPTVIRDGKLLDLDYFGAGYQSVFAGAPEALAHAKTYRDKRIAGFSLMSLAIASLLAELVVVLVAPEAISVDGDVVVPSLGWLAASTGVALVGLVVHGSANTDLNEAVDAYNRQLRAKNAAMFRWSTRF